MATEEEKEKIKGNGYIVLNGLKGIYTMDEVIELLHLHNLKVRISMSTKDDIHQSHESSNQVEERR